jgi:hypothetical protein
MTKQEWREHRAETGPHDGKYCPSCQARKKTIIRNVRAKSIRAVYADLGMVRVKGNLGGTYYE